MLELAGVARSCTVVCVKLVEKLSAAIFDVSLTEAFPTVGVLIDWSTCNTLLDSTFDTDEPLTDDSVTTVRNGAVTL